MERARPRSVRGGALGLERRVARPEVVEPERGILGGAQGEEAHEVGR